MVLRPEERTAIAALTSFMSRERGKTYNVRENADDPPDVIADEMPGSHCIGIEHTQIVPQDRESLAAWGRFRDELVAVTPPPGTFIVGPATFENRFPRVAGSLRDVVAHVVSAIRAHSTWNPGTAIIVPQEPQIKVMMVASTGAALIGLLTLTPPHWPKVLRALQDRVATKTNDVQRWQPVDERILLMDATSATAITRQSLAEHLYDDVWFLHQRALLAFDSVYLVHEADVERIWPR